MAFADVQRKIVDVVVLQSKETERIDIEANSINRNVLLVSAEAAAAATIPLSTKC